jgi:iron complex outermembrane receptor protein
MLLEKLHQDGTLLLLIATPTLKLLKALIFLLVIKFPNVPRNQASLWTTYELQNGGLQGLGFGLGLFYVDARQGDLENTFKLPSYLRTDAAIFYRRDNWRAGINLQNLFDVGYFETSEIGRNTVIPGTPLTVIGSFSIEF